METCDTDFSSFNDEYQIQKNRIYLEVKIRSRNLEVINLKHSCGIRAQYNIYLKQENRLSGRQKSVNYNDADKCVCVCTWTF